MTSNPSFVNGWMNVTVYIRRRIQFSISNRLLMNRPTSRRILLTRMAFFSDGIFCIVMFSLVSLWLCPVLLSKPFELIPWRREFRERFLSTRYFPTLLAIPTTKRRLGLNIAQSRRNEMLLRYRQQLLGWNHLP